MLRSVNQTVKSYRMDDEDLVSPRPGRPMFLEWKIDPTNLVSRCQVERINIIEILRESLMWETVHASSDADGQLALICTMCIRTVL